MMKRAKTKRAKTGLSRETCAQLAEGMIAEAAKYHELAAGLIAEANRGVGDTDTLERAFLMGAVCGSRYGPLPEREVLRRRRK